MKAGKRKTERADARGGGFFLLPHCVMASEAFRTATPRAIKLLFAICAKHNGFNNGSISLGFRELAVLMDSSNNAGNGRALCELIERGLVALAKSYPKGQRLANEYRLTFVEAHGAPASNDYLSWSTGDAGTRKRGNFRASETSTRSGFRVSITSTGEETSRFENLNGVHAKQPFSRDPPVSITSTHIVQPYEAKPASPLKSTGKENGQNSAAPDGEELRTRVRDVLGASERGSQGLLAAMAAIRPAALSKFLSETGSLNDQARIRLTMALPKLEQRQLVG